MKNTAICENHLYNKVYRKGKSYVGRCIVVYVLRDYAADKLAKAHPQKLKTNRVGLSVSKKIGGAVERNRAKRIIRAAYDCQKANLKTGFLIVITARTAIAGKKSGEITHELEAAFERLDMLDRKVKPSEVGDRPRDITEEG